MVPLLEIKEFLDDYLKISEINDMSWNGLQFEGNEQVNKIAFAVDAGVAVFEKAKDFDLLVVHHGLFWNGVNPSLRGFNKERLDLLYKNDLSLYAAHLPLDRHKEIGNNALLLDMIGADIVDEFHFMDGKNISWVGKLKETPLQTIIKKINSGLATESTVLDFGKDMISTVAVCSGGPGISILGEAIERGVDLYIAGESCEAYHLAKDAKMNVIFSGHHATETLGISKLAEIVEKKFGVKTEFISNPTGL